MTLQTRRRIARPPAARSAATHRERPHCPAWSGAPPTAAKFPINPLADAVLRAAVGAHHEDRRLVVARALEDDLLAIRRPRRVRVVTARVRQLAHLAAA